MEWITEKEAETLIALLKIRRENRIKYIGNNGYKYKSRRQLAMLNRIYNITNYPSTDTRNDIAVLLDIPQRSVQIWFQNTRQSMKDPKFVSSTDQKMKSILSGFNIISSKILKSTSEFSFKFHDSYATMNYEGNSFDISAFNLIKVYQEVQNEDYSEESLL
ncbi:homeobox domain-containing protein [Hamiltosporidium magnivora]|uniref:Homeobox domain-containing protein n=1 Tax=Hamiltosporidium magnivora TaxID=148818 RepID=A0A4Q9LLQ1_9MICR|nr:homeobox domain-containing protein [Hamiltosporidium magnivora]TBU09415.1 homeobox domain-containing protein [Hamiltosporidium magnivora]